MKKVLFLLVLIAFSTSFYAQNIAVGTYESETKNFDQIFSIVLRTIPLSEYSVKNTDKDGGTIVASRNAKLEAKEFSSMTIFIAQTDGKIIIHNTMVRNSGFIGGGKPQDWVKEFGELLKEQIPDLTIKVVKK